MVAVRNVFLHGTSVKCLTISSCALTEISPEVAAGSAWFRGRSDDAVPATEPSVPDTGVVLDDVEPMTAYPHLRINIATVTKA